MQRRAFTLGAASLAAFAPQLWAQTQPSEGKDYRKLKQSVPSDLPADQVEVVEFFWYSCGHCNAFEPTFAAWKQKAPAHINIQRVPVAFNASFVPEQKLYYTLQTLPNFDVLHVKAFQTIHQERKRLNKDDLVFAWAKQQGLDVDKFKEVYNSFTVANQVRKATQLQQAYDVEGVPSMGVAGRYYTDGSMAGSMDRVLRTVEHLVEQSRKAG